MHVSKGSRQKSSFLSGLATKAFSPSPLGFVAIGIFFLTFKKVLFSLVAHHFSALPPFFLVARPLRRELFFGFPISIFIKLSLDSYFDLYMEMKI